MVEQLEMIEVNSAKDFTVNNYDTIQEDNLLLKIQDDINNFHNLNSKIVALESYRETLIQTKACCKTDVVNLVSMGISQEAFPHFNSFTSAKSPINHGKVIRVITDTIIKFGNKMLEILMRLIEKGIVLFSNVFDKQNALTRNFNLLRKNADKVNVGVHRMVLDKTVFGNLAGMHPGDLDTIKKRVKIFLEHNDITDYDVNSIGQKSLLGLYSELLDIVILKKSNGLIADAINKKEYISTLESFVNIDLSDYITEFNTFINTEIPDQELTRQYRSLIRFFFPRRYTGKTKDVSKLFCDEVDLLMVGKGDFDLSGYSFHDKAGLTFLSTFSQDIFKRTYTKRHLEEANKLIKSKFSVQTGFHASEMEPEYHETIMSFYENLESFVELTRRVENYNDSLIKLVSAVNRCLEFQADLANYLNSKY